jgi:hypothetical protein
MKTLELSEASKQQEEKSISVSIIILLTKRSSDLFIYL